LMQIPSENCKFHEKRTEKLVDLLCSVELINDVDGPFVWLDLNTPCRRDPLTHSLFNNEEAKIVAKLATDVADIVGDNRVMVVTPYRSQVRPS
jgi:superfamily I DNA and/or RNA helicase